MIHVYMALGLLLLTRTHLYGSQMPPKATALAPQPKLNRATRIRRQLHRRRLLSNNALQPHLLLLRMSL